jgi:TetR/AcrR family transcriptional regulator of autoinduction and epiphytic fitness
VTSPQQVAHDADDLPPPQIDGRTRRAHRNRTSVVDALLALWEEGDLHPTAQRVAARAEVALRTVYGHFTDMETLYLEAGHRELATLQQLADVPPGHLPYDERLERFADSRARVLERLLPVMRATRVRPMSPALERNWRLYIKVGDDEVRGVFRQELDRLAPDRQAALLDALYLASSVSAWDVLRADRALDPAPARQVVRDSVHALITAALAATPGDAP